MIKKIIITFLFFVLLLPIQNTIFAAENNYESNYTKLTTVDLSTFNEYRYKITEQFFELRNKFEIEWGVDKEIAIKILNIAKNWYNYLPINLSNKNIFNKLKTSIERGIKYPDSEASYTSIVQNIQNYLTDVDIERITWKVEAFPSTWNAPLTVTFRWNVKDPSWTKIPSHSYIWRMNINWKRKVLQNTRWASMNYTFKEEWNFSVFLDIKSGHKNENWYTDVLSFRSRADIKVKEKIASVIIKVNGLSLRQKDELKFTPEEARYGLLFDATSSTPTSWSKFVETQWEFWNGIVEKYNWPPRIERVIYNKEWEYRVRLTLRTNEWKTTKREFDIVIHKPIASIKSNIEEWFLWDKFTFSAENQLNENNLGYSWEIIDIEEDKIIFRKTWSLFTYVFIKKWKYNVKLKVTEPWSNVPDIDTRIIYINSRAPEPHLETSIPFEHKPNTVLLDATKSFDPDFSDEGNLKFSWKINWKKTLLDKPNYNWSVWYHTFDSMWDHSIVLEVTDPDGITVQRKDKVKIKSILSVEFFAFPRVIQREWMIHFNANSPKARFFEWNFWDGEIKWWKKWKISHKYKKSWVFEVKLKVIDEDDNFNMFTKNVYIGESNTPFALITLKNSRNSELFFKNDVCEWEWAYIIDKVDAIKFSWDESIDVTWERSWLTYSWKLKNDIYYSTTAFSKKFDELGCFPIQLKVKSKLNWKTSTSKIWVKVENLKPILSSIDVKIVDNEADPVVVKVKALWARDKDGVIQSYLWYYYTDLDTDPQDFRATKDASTTFVLPKVTWNYYFVVLMKDNNEARIGSEEITGSRYFITLAWNNVNTPLIKLKSNKTSVYIWEEIIFTAKVENILWQNISKKVKYSWDLDGDGFYEKETDIPSISYKFNSSWEYHSKVKVKHKWYSNTKSITIWVANILKPSFSYISIWNQFVFLDKSTGRYDYIKWDLWDKNQVSWKDSFIYNYSDNKNSHIVKLEIREWAKIRNTEKKVVKNMKNYVLSRKDWFIVFSNPILESNKIILEKAEKVHMYLQKNDTDTKNYAFDLDTEIDSNLNWSADDDEDLKWEFVLWKSEPILIKLNKKRVQNIKLITKNASWSLVDFYNFAIEKLYIEKEAQIKDIIVEWISDSEKIKIEKLKEYINTLLKEHKLKALMYVQKLQEEWFDIREKTNVIYEFENYIVEVDESNWEDAINLLESLLVEWQEDQSEKSIIFNALKNLLPQTILCNEKLDDGSIKEEKDCYKSLVEKLETIKENNNVEENKVLAKIILNAVIVDEVMTKKQKIDFRAILKTFVYGWIQNIPEEEEELDKNENEWSKNVFWLIKTILFWIFTIFGIFIFIVFLYYLYYKLTNKDPNIWFQDFIIEKTSNKKSEEKEEEDLEQTDVMKELENKPLTPTPLPEALTPTLSQGEKEKNKEEIEQKESKIKKGEKDEVPSWLKGSISDGDIKKEEKPLPNPPLTGEGVEQKDKEKKQNKKNYKEKPIERSSPSTPLPRGEESSTKEEKQSEKKEKVPDWLKGSIPNEDIKKDEKSPHPNPLSKGEGEEQKREQKDEDIKQSKKNNKEKEQNNKDNKTKEENIEKKSSTTQKENDKKRFQLPKNEDLDELIKITEDTNKKEEGVEKKEDINKEEDNIPDWLKSSFEVDENNEKRLKKDPETWKKKEIPDWIKSSASKKENSKNEEKPLPNPPLTGEGAEQKREQKREQKDKDIKQSKKNNKEKEQKIEGKEKEQNNKDNKTKEDKVEANVTKEDSKTEKNDKIKEKRTEDKKTKSAETKEAKITESKKIESLKKDDTKKEEQEEEKVPDWLKGSIWEKDTKKEIKTETKSLENKKKSTKTDNRDPEKKTTWNQIKTEKKWIEDGLPQNSTKSSLEEKEKNEEKTNNNDLWDDGMKIPDWLKTDSSDE
jgi:hypothetical protein